MVTLDEVDVVDALLLDEVDVVDRDDYIATTKVRVPFSVIVRACSSNSMSAPDTLAIFLFVAPPLPSTNAASSLAISMTFVGVVAAAAAAAARAAARAGLGLVVAVAHLAALAAARVASIII